MKQKKPKKTFLDQNAQSFLKSARIVDGRLLVSDRRGASYHAQRSPSGALALTDIANGWGASLLMDAWCEAELAWWEAQLEELQPSEVVWLLLDEGGVVVGHLAAQDLAINQERAHPFRLNNAARRPLPALGELYSPPPEPVRPRRTRGISVRPQNPPFFAPSGTTFAAS
jgi:hypothetical protein